MIDNNELKRKYDFCVVYLTKDYYPMFEGCIYKFTRANFKDVLVINVDMGSLPENLGEGVKICNRLDIKMVDKKAISYQEGLKVADDYLSKNKIDVNWMMCPQHDVIPLRRSFWDDSQEIIDSIDSEKVGMVGANCFMKYSKALKGIEVDGVFEAIKLSGDRVRIGRGMLSKNILGEPYGGWYMSLPDEYYKSKYFAVESPYWTCFIMNRKLFKKYIQIDYNFIFELWPDDLAYQFLSNGIINISVPKLFVCHDHILKQGIKINAEQLVESRGDFSLSHMRFWKKWGFRWGVRNPDVRLQFEKESKMILSDHALQRRFFDIDINDGPLDIDLKSKAPML
ncbi:hypothetical protein CMI47_12165 [Candidatus Pacearchaeota archaeon]|nr:hypothetical protein [Candidatus Pacearchaeota archaeon]